MDADKPHSVTVEAGKAGVNATDPCGSGVRGDFDPTRSSTPTKQSVGTGSISERVSLVLKQHPCKSYDSYQGRLSYMLAFSHHSLPQSA